MYVGLISDTHGVFSDGVKDFLAPVDVIWHAGDWGGDASFAEDLDDPHRRFARALLSPG